jgi:hypothetical protein
MDISEKLSAATRLGLATSPMGLAANAVGKGLEMLTGKPNALSEGLDPASAMKDLLGLQGKTRAKVLEAKGRMKDEIMNYPLITENKPWTEETARRVRPTAANHNGGPVDDWIYRSGHDVAEGVSGQEVPRSQAFRGDLN